MAAPKKNQFWKLRSNHGRDKLFQSPELLWEAACEYFEWNAKNPWFKFEAIKSGERVGKLVKIPTARPLTLHGLCLYLDCSANWWKEFRAAKHEDFLAVTSRIDEIIYRQKFEGAAVGAFNANIIARDLGLVDKSDISSAGQTLQKQTIIVRDAETKELLDRLT